MSGPLPCCSTFCVPMFNASFQCDVVRGVLSLPTRCTLFTTVAVDHAEEFMYSVQQRTQAVLV